MFRLCVMKNLIESGSQLLEDDVRHVLLLLVSGSINPEVKDFSLLSKLCEGLEISSELIGIFILSGLVCSFV